LLTYSSNKSWSFYTITRPLRCPKHICPTCRTAPTVFPYHSFCAQALIGSSILPSDDDMLLHQLGQALASSIPVDEPSNAHLRDRRLGESFCEGVLQKIPKRCNAEQYQCIPCLLHRISSLLPPEILSYILSYINQTYLYPPNTSHLWRDFPSHLFTSELSS
jgi:hypothetical protein